jgi:hypothetical protein
MVVAAGRAGILVAGVVLHVTQRGAGVQNCQVNRKCLSRCGGMLCASPALAAYRASMARTPRVEYGFFHEDSNRKAAPLSRAALMCRARVSLKAWDSHSYGQGQSSVGVSIGFGT